MYFGPDEVLFNLDIQFPKGLAVSDVVAAVDRLEKVIRNRHPEITRIFIEADSNDDRGSFRGHLILGHVSGKILPGLRMFNGSNARLILLCSAMVVGSITRGR